MILVYAFENGSWSPMVLTVDPRTKKRFLAFNPQFVYSLVYSIDGFNYLIESFYESVSTVTKVQHSRVLCIADFEPPVLRQNGTPHYYRLAEPISYEPKVHTLVSVPSVEVDHTINPQIRQIWLDYHSPRPPQPPAEWYAAMQQMHEAQQRIAYDAQIAASASANAQQLLFQAQREIAVLKEQLQGAAKSLSSGSTSSTQDSDEQIDQQDQEIHDTSTTPTRSGSAPPILVMAVRTLTPPPPAALVKTKKQLKEERRIKLEEVRQTKVRELINQLLILVQEPAKLPEQIYTKLNDLDALMQVQDREYLLTALNGLAINLCVELLSNKKRVSSKIKELLLHRLVAYNDEIFSTLDFRNEQQFANIAHLATKNKELQQKVKDQSKRYFAARKAKLVMAEAQPVKITSVELTPKQKMAAAVQELNFSAYTQLVEEDLNLSEFASREFKKLLASRTTADYDKLKQFMIGLQLSENVISTTIQDEEMPKVVKLAVMHKLSTLEVKRYYMMNVEFNFLVLYDVLSQDAEISDQGLEDQIIALNTEAFTWAANKLAETFAIFSGQIKGGKIDATLLPLFANRVNDDGQSILMLAIKQNYGLDKLRPIMRGTGKRILQVDNDNCNIWHYFTKYPKPEYMELISEARVLYEQEAEATGLDVLAEVNRQESVTANTYMHYLLQWKNEKDVLQVLKALFDNKGKPDTYLNPFYGSALVQNNACESGAVVLDKKPKEWSATRALLYRKIVDELFRLLSRYKREHNIYFRGNNFLCTSIDTDVINGVIDRKDFNRLFEIVESRIKLQNDIAEVSIYFMTPDLAGEMKECLAMAVYLGIPNVCEQEYRGKTLFGHFADHICASNDKEFEQKYNKSLLCEVMRESIKSSDTVLWKRAIPLIKKDKKSLNELAIVGDFFKYITSEPIKAEEFIKMMILANDFDLLIVSLNTTPDKVRSRIVHALCDITSGSVGYSFIVSLLRQATPELAEELTTYFIEYAVNDNKLALAKHMVEVCGVVINERIALFALSIAADEFETLGYVFDNFTIPEDEPKSVSEKRIYSMFTWAMTSSCARNKVSWLIDRGYDITATNGERNILHVLLMRAIEIRRNILTNGKVDKGWDLTEILNIMTMLCQDENKAKVLVKQLNRADANHSCVFYLATLGVICPVDPDILYSCFELLLAHGAELATISTDPGYTAVHYAIDRNSKELLDLFADSIEGIDLYGMLIRKNAVGETVIDIARKKVAKGELGKEILDEIEDLELELRPGPGLSAGFMQGLSQLRNVFG